MHTTILPITTRLQEGKFDSYPASVILFEYL